MCLPRSAIDLGLPNDFFYVSCGIYQPNLMYGGAPAEKISFARRKGLLVLDL
jgi:hypothetical protein